MTSETTAAAAGLRGVLRNDPFAMRPFCGYNIGDYFKHWLSFSGRTDPKKLPKIFHVNWFRKNKYGDFLWPGFGDNLRVLDWILKRTDEEPEETAIAEKSPIGFVPKAGAIDTNGLDISPEVLKQLLAVNKKEWLVDASKNKDFLRQVGERLPTEINQEFDSLVSRLQG